MKSMKIMLPALLLSLSLGAFAQDDDELLDATSADEAPEVFVAAHPWEKPIFHRIQLGYIGTRAKYTNSNPAETILGNESYFLSGLSLTWLTDIVLSKKCPLYIGIGASFNYQTGRYNGSNVKNASLSYDWNSRVQGFYMTIPISISYQFRDVFTKGLTLAPYAGVYGRFNFVASRRQEKTTYFYNAVTGEVVDSETSTETKTLMKAKLEGGWPTAKPHAGKLFQAGVQVGVNAFYQRYSFGLAYMHDLIPFASHISPDTVDGTNCDMKISTRHNIAINFGYFF